MDVNLKNTPSEIDRLIDKYKSTVYGIAIARLGSKADADDVFQEVFLAAYRKGITVKDNDEEKFWLIRTTLNQCKKITLSSWRRRTVPLEERKEEVSFFRSRDEIAEIMKVRSGTVRMQLTRAREMLKEKLKGGYFYE